jgi:hypothetical protein
MIFDDEQVESHLSEAWEHDSGKDEKLNVVLQGLEQHFWRGTEAGWLGCYDFAGETWAGDGSVHKCAMGAGSVCLQRPGRSLTVRVGREEEGVSSLRPELAAIAGATVLRVLCICSGTFKKLFCFSFYVLPRKDVANLCLCPQLLQLPISFPPNKLEISFCLAMH